MVDRRPDAASEKRLDAIRREAESHGQVSGKGVRPEGSPFPRASAEEGYYGLPLLKPPVWTWEIPLYFFVGGAAGATAMLGAAAQLTGVDRKLVRDARWIAALGAAASAPLLISDLGRPMRFLNMLRVLKPQSPMSVGAWILAGFGTTSAVALVPVKLVGDAAGLLAAASGLGMATYTGVLIGATAIPVWSRNVSLLPVHFGASALSSAVALLELRGHDEKALNALGVTAAAVETVIAIRLESRGEHSAAMAKAAAMLGGPVPLILRLAGRRRAAAVSSLIGSLLTRFAWMEAGRKSALRNV